MAIKMKQTEQKSRTRETWDRSPRQIAPNSGIVGGIRLLHAVMWEEYIKISSTSYEPN